jgi:hypothetical protein
MPLPAFWVFVSALAHNNGDSGGYPVLMVMITVLLIIQ